MRNTGAGFVVLSHHSWLFIIFIVHFVLVYVYLGYIHNNCTQCLL